MSSKGIPSCHEIVFLFGFCEIQYKRVRTLSIHTSLVQRQSDPPDHLRFWPKLREMLRPRWESGTQLPFYFHKQAFLKVLGCFNPTHKFVCKNIYKCYQCWPLIGMKPAQKVNHTRSGKICPRHTHRYIYIYTGANNWM